MVFGTSAAAGIVTSLALRHPAGLRGVAFHEPLFQSGVTNTATVRGGTRAATELFLLSVAGQETYASLDPQLRERLLLNGDVLLNIEMATYLEYEPTPAQLASMRLPRLVTAGADNRDEAAPGHWRYEAASWLASQLDTPLVELPGGHTGYLGQPVAFAETLRLLLDKMTN